MVKAASEAASHAHQLRCCKGGCRGAARQQQGAARGRRRAAVAGPVFYAPGPGGHGDAAGPGVCLPAARPQSGVDTHCREHVSSSAALQYRIMFTATSLHNCILHRWRKPRSFAEPSQQQTRHPKTSGMATAVPASCSSHTPALNVRLALAAAEQPAILAC